MLNSGEFSYSPVHLWHNGVMRWSIRYQLLVPLLALLLGVTGLSTYLAVAAAQRAVEDQIESRVRHVVRVIAESPYRPNHAILKQMHGLSGAEFVMQAESEPPVMTRTISTGSLPSPGWTGEQWQQVKLGPVVSLDGEEFRASGVVMNATPERPSKFTLHILYPEAQWREALWQAIRPPLLLGGLGAFLSVAFAVLVTQRWTRRIRDLDQRTRLIAQGDFSPRPLPAINDELRDLSQSVNDMAARLDQLQKTVLNTERLRVLGEVGGALAHQLRNAVTGARLALQLHARECPQQPADEALDVALRQLAVIEEKLKRFLDLGRADERKPEPRSLVAIVDEAVGLLRPQAEHLRTALTWDKPAGDPLALIGDAGQLGHLFLNVIGNALEAAGPGGRVALRLQREPGANGSAALASLTVADSGPGPPPHLAARLFEPFVTGKEHGVGLGLAIAKQVTERHGGTIAWERVNGETRFVIRLPLTEASRER
jgi:signal transduction histidine kinase